MEPLDSSAPAFMDDLLDFTSDIEEDDEESPSGAILPFNVPNHFLTESVDEELEWLSNKDAFPTVETFLDGWADHPDEIFKHESPVSVLESNSNSNNSGSTIITSYCGSLRVPVRARSKRVRGRRQVGGSVDILMQQLCWRNNETNSVSTGPKPQPAAVIKMGRKCLHCGAEKTPQWRAGPLGAKTLCNACGVRYKSGRLVPEYRPASSPTFSSSKHSNSHRKIVEMRKLKHTGMGVKGMVKG